MKKHNNEQNAQTRMGNGKRLSFSLAAPSAKSVQLVGDFTHWQQKPINMQRGADGTWRTDVELERGEHHYRFLVDGAWQDDPKCATHVANTFGSEDCVCQVG